MKLSNIVPQEGNGYTSFIPTNSAELELDENGGAKYRTENGGEIKIKIAAGTIVDQSGNTSNDEPLLEAGNIDVTSPEIYEIRRTQDATNNKETIVFNVTDRNFDTISTNKITTKMQLIF